MQMRIIKRERAAGTYRAFSAYLAKVLSQIPIVMFSTLLFSIPVYWTLALKNTAESFFTFLVINVVHSLTSCFMGIMISSGVPNARIGQIVGPLVIVIFLMFGGQMMSLASVNAGIRWLKWLSIIYYAYLALASNELLGLEFQCLDPIPNCKMTGELLIEKYNLNDFDEVWKPVLCNAAIGVMSIIIGYVLFRWRSRPLMKLR
jgi:ABC-type multidrug transport system permease subunit